VRLLVAFLAAPLLPALLPAWFAAMRGYQPLTVYVLVCAAFYVLQAVVGAPVYRWLGHGRRHRIWIYALLGFLSVALPIFVYASIREAGRPVSEQMLFLALYLGLLGGISAALFWLMARPDRKSRGKPL
jgi:sensor c-di-GMP phosphodiesterase-like protein